MNRSENINKYTQRKLEEWLVNLVLEVNIILAAYFETGGNHSTKLRKPEINLSKTPFYPFSLLAINFIFNDNNFTVY
ncbi:MAG: hypothetical protein IEMM0008_0717 [bacterium]|nr:MAG: hypothetical protein IEMM0008_0717 [bacterium]